MNPLRLLLGGGLAPGVVDRLHAGMLVMGHEAGLDPDAVPVAALLVEEICTNIMEHSNATWLEVVLLSRSGQVWVQVSDDGAPFDIPSAIQALGQLDLHEIRERRLGLHMIKKLSKSVHGERDDRGFNRVEFEVGAEVPADERLR